MRLKSLFTVVLAVSMSFGFHISSAQMTAKEAEQHTTNKLLRALEEASKRPQGETRAQRQDRLNNLSEQMRQEDAAIMQRQTDYDNASTKRILNTPDKSVEFLEQAGIDYSSQRANRLKPSTATPANQNPDAKPAGFGSGYAGGYPEPAPTNTAAPTGATPGKANRGRRTAKAAGNVEEVSDEVAVQPCQCRGGDTLVFGIHCVKQGYYIEVPSEKDWANGTVYEIGEYPRTEQCKS